MNFNYNYLTGHDIKSLQIESSQHPNIYQPLLASKLENNYSLLNQLGTTVKLMLLVNKE